VQELAVAIAAQVDADASAPVPVVILGKSHYTHKSYGRIFTPIFDIQKWMAMDGEVVEAEAEAPARRRRSATA